MKFQLNKCRLVAIDPEAKPVVCVKPAVVNSSPNVDSLKKLLSEKEAELRQVRQELSQSKSQLASLKSRSSNSQAQEKIGDLSFRERVMARQTLQQQAEHLNPSESNDNQLS